MITYWHRITLMNDKTLVKQTLDFVVNNEPEQSDWLLTVKCLINAMGLNYIYDNPHSINNGKFKEMSKEKLGNLLILQWHTKIAETTNTNGQNNKLRVYSQFKKTWKFESYLDQIGDFYLRKIITKFPCSDHDLEIETGRHRKIKVEDRICKICNNGIENEKHFLQDCPLYTTIRNTHLGKLQLQSHIDVLQCKNKATVYSLLNYLKKGFCLRKEVLALPYISPETMNYLMCQCL